MRRNVFDFNNRYFKFSYKTILLFTVLMLYVIQFLPTSFLIGLGIFVTIDLIAWYLIKSYQIPKTYINERGYVVLADSNELEHRSIAKQILNRELKSNEIVHHINGRRTNNKIYNLCLMDKEKHELFHSWLSWKKNKSGYYPKFNDQKRILVEEYGGILLENLSVNKTNELQNISETENFQNDDEFSFEFELDDNVAKILFEELRKERLKIAREENLPAYKIFYDKTLHQMIRSMPDSNEKMLKLLGPSKYQKYGPSFLAVIRNFKEHEERKRSKVPG